MSSAIKKNLSFYIKIHQRTHSTAKCLNTINIFFKQHFERDDKIETLNIFAIYSICAMRFSIFFSSYFVVYSTCE